MSATRTPQPCKITLSIYSRNKCRRKFCVIFAAFVVDKNHSTETVAQSLQKKDVHVLSTRVNVETKLLNTSFNQYIVSTGIHNRHFLFRRITQRKFDRLVLSTRQCPIIFRRTFSAEHFFEDPDNISIDVEGWTHMISLCHITELSLRNRFYLP